MMHGLSRETRRAMRRARRKRATELNIVSMIDILTVLVFFLLVNATGVSILGINLPDANAKPPDKPKQALSVIIRSDTLTVADTNGPLQNFPSSAQGYDYPGVARFLRKLKERDPSESHITLLLEPNVAYDALVQLMDAVRLQPTPDGRGNRELYPDISLGDAPPAASGGKP